VPGEDTSSPGTTAKQDRPNRRGTGAAPMPSCQARCPAPRGSAEHHDAHSRLTAPWDTGSLRGLFGCGGRTAAAAGSLA